jgi:hypothetical protein
MVAAPARKWLLETKNSLALHNGLRNIHGGCMATYAALIGEEEIQRGAVLRAYHHARDVCRYTSEAEPYERLMIVADESDSRRELRSEMLLARNTQVPLLVASNLMLQALELEMADLLGDFSDTLDTILCAEGLDREDLVASLVRRGKDPFRSPSLAHQPSSPSHHPPSYMTSAPAGGAVNPYIGLANHSHHQQQSYRQPQYVSGGSGRYNPHSPPQPHRTSNSTAPSHVHQGVYYQPQHPNPHRHQVPPQGRSSHSTSAASHHPQSTNHHMPSQQFQIGRPYAPGQV